MSDLYNQLIPSGVAGATAITALLKNPDILKMIYQDLAQPSVIKIGKALETVFGLSNTLLLPIKLVNEKSNILFKRNLDRFKEKLEGIPLESIADISPEIGIPIVDKFTYIQDIDISELYTNLLSKAADDRNEGRVHPYFVNAISNICPDEAKLIQNVYELFVKRGDFYIPYQEIQLREVRGKFQSAQYIIRKYIINIELVENLTTPHTYRLYIDNLIALGFLQDHDDGSLSDIDKFYKPIEEQNKDGYEKVRTKHETEERKLRIDNKYLEITETGKEFMRLVNK